jgi:RNA polymerase sigma-70 factor, ECF subfamily
MTNIRRADAELIADGLSGNREAFDILFSSYRPFLLRLARRMIRQHEEAEDAVQNCLLQAYRNLNSFKRQAAFRTWLGRILVNEAITILRKRKVHQVNEAWHSTVEKREDTGKPICEPQPDPEQVLARKESIIAVIRKVSELSSQQRFALLLCGIREYTGEEASQILRVSPSIVRSRLFRARRQLASLLYATEATRRVT